MRRIAPLALPTLAFVASWALPACNDRECLPDGTCRNRELRCDPVENLCKVTCERREDCLPAGTCVRGFCSELDSPAVDGSSDVGAADASSGVDAAGSDASSGVDAAALDGGACEGDEGCGCYDNGTCNLGYRCAVDRCVRAVGERDQPCFPNSTCREGLECVRRTEGSICRSLGLGGVGEPCFSWVPLGDGLECRSPTATCQSGLCLGGVRDPCDDDRECRRELTCIGGLCEPEPTLTCATSAACGAGQLCCGEAGTWWSNPAHCLGGSGVPVRFGACFDPPASTFAVACLGDDDCRQAPVGSPDASGTSQCMPWGPAGAGVCSAPCDGGSGPTGCPNGWACAFSLATCFEDGECGGRGATCVDANRTLLRPSRCRCDGAVAPSGGCGEGSSCEPDGQGGLACVVTRHCTPPGR